VCDFKLLVLHAIYLFSMCFSASDVFVLRVAVLTGSVLLSVTKC
jgi:hypothetical protein